MANGLKVERYPIERVRDFVNVDVNKLENLVLFVGDKNLVISLDKYFYSVDCDCSLSGLWVDLMHSRAYVDLFSLENILRREIKGFNFEFFYDYGIPFHPKEVFSSMYGEDLNGTLDIEDILENIFFYANLRENFPVSEITNIERMEFPSDSLSWKIKKLYEDRGAFFIERKVYGYRTYEMMNIFRHFREYSEFFWESSFLKDILKLFKDNSKEILLLSGFLYHDFSISGQLVDLDNGGILGYFNMYLLLKDPKEMSIRYNITLSEEDLSNYLDRFSNVFRKFLGRDPYDLELEYLNKELFFFSGKSYSVRINLDTKRKLQDFYVSTISIYYFLNTDYQNKYKSR